MFGFGDRAKVEVPPEKPTEKRRKRKSKRKKKKASAEPEAEADPQEEDEEEEEEDGFDELLGLSKKPAPNTSSARASPTPVPAATTSTSAVTAAPAAESAGDGAQVSAQALAQLRATQVIQANPEEQAMKDTTDSIVSAAVQQGYEQDKVERVMSDMFAASEAFDDLDAVLDRLRNEAAAAAAEPQAFRSQAPTKPETDSFAPMYRAVPSPSVSPSLEARLAATGPTGSKNKATGLERHAAPSANTTPLALPALSPTPSVDPSALAKIENVLGRATGPDVKATDAAYVIQGLLTRSPRPVALSFVSGRSLRNVLQAALQSFGEGDAPTLKPALVDLLSAVFTELGGNARLAGDAARDAVDLVESVGRQSHGVSNDVLGSMALSFAATLRAMGLGLFTSGGAEGGTPSLGSAPLNFGEVAETPAEDLLSDRAALQRLFKDRDNARDRTARSLSVLRSDVQSLELQTLAPGSSAMETPEALRQALEMALSTAQEQMNGHGNGGAAPSGSASQAGATTAAADAARAEVDALRDALAKAMTRLATLQRGVTEADALVTATRRALDQKTQQLQLATESATSSEMALRSRHVQAHQTEAALRAAIEGEMRLRRSFGGTMQNGTHETPEAAADVASEALGTYLESLLVYLKDSTKCLECLEELVRTENAEMEKIGKESVVYRSIGGMASMTADLDAKASALNASIRANVDSIIFLREDMKGVVGGVAAVNGFLRGRVSSSTLAGHPMLSRQHAALQMVMSRVERFDAQMPLEDSLLRTLDTMLQELDELRGSVEGVRKGSRGYSSVRA